MYTPVVSNSKSNSNVKIFHAETLAGYWRVSARLWTHLMHYNYAQIFMLLITAEK